VDNEKEWEEISKKFKIRAEKLISSSVDLRTQMSLFFVHACESLQIQVARTNFAFACRIKDIKRRKEDFENQHVMVKLFKQIDNFSVLGLNIINTQLLSTINC